MTNNVMQIKLMIDGKAVKGETLPFKQNVLIFRSNNRVRQVGRDNKWWLYYPETEQLTGGFKLKQHAIKWYEDGER